MTYDEYKNLNKDDVIVCINNKNYITLTIGNKYKVNNISTYDNSICILNDRILYGFYFYTRFITLIEFELLHRKEKINKIYGTKR